MEEKKRIEEEKIKKQSYSEYLKKQMEEHTKKEQNSRTTEMTENERRMNSKDIENIERRSLNLVNAKIIGMRESPILPHQKYIAPQYGLYNYTPMNKHANLN